MLYHLFTESIRQLLLQLHTHPIAAAPNMAWEAKSRDLTTLNTRMIELGTLHPVSESKRGSPTYARATSGSTRDAALYRKRYNFRGWSSSASRRNRCNLKTMTRDMLIELLRTGRLCHYRMARFRFGLSG